MVTQDNICRIAGRTWNVKVVGIERSYSRIEGDNAGRSLAVGSPMILDPVGTSHSHSITVARSGDFLDEYDALYNLISFPTKEGLDVEIVFGQSVLAYRAYSTSGKQGLQYVGRDGRVFWDTFTFALVPMKAQVLPNG